MMESNFQLGSFAICLSPETELDKNRAFQRIILNLVCRTFSDKPFGLREIENLVESNNLRKTGVAIAIDQLVIERNLDRINGSFVINKGYKSIIDFQSNDLRRRIKDIASEILGQNFTKYPYESYERVIMVSLTTLTSRYGLLLADNLIGAKRTKKDEINQEEFVAICGNAIKDEKIFDIDPQEMANNIIFLLQRGDENLNRVIYNLVQNYYSMRLLGADISIDLFSELAFKDSLIFLDTNCLIALLQKKNRLHEEIKELLFLIKEFNSKAMVSQATLDELDHSFPALLDAFIRAVDEMPVEMYSDVDDPLLFEYQEIVKNNPTTSPSEFIVKYNDTTRILQQLNLEIFDINDNDLIGWSRKEQNRVEEIIDWAWHNRTGRKKGPHRIYHDAHVFFLVQHIRKEKSADSAAWFVTLDTTLSQAGKRLQKKEDAPFSIRVDEFLQTTSPFIKKDEQKRTFEQLFVKMVIDRILPQEDFLKLEDFRIFTDLDYRFKNLPPEVIKQAIRHVQKEILKGGGMRDELRPIIARELAIMFSDPEKYFPEYADKLKREIEAEKKRADEIKVESDRKKSEYEESAKRQREISELEKKEVEMRGQRQLEELSKEKNLELRQNITRINELTQERDNYKRGQEKSSSEREEERREKERIRKKLHVSITLFITIILTALIWSFNLLSVPFFNMTKALAFQICLIIGTVYLIFPEKYLPKIVAILGIIASLALGLLL